MGKSEIEKLRILLEHWVEHNKEHSEEFREWAARAGDLGEELVSRDMLEAAEYMDKAAESLLMALQRLGERRS